MSSDIINIYDKAVKKIRNNKEDNNMDNSYVEERDISLNNNEEAITFKVTKSWLIKLNLISLLVGLTLGILISLSFFSSKLISEKQKHVETTLEANHIIKTQKSNIEEINNVKSKLVFNNKEMENEIDSLLNELFELRNREELFDEYEYILMDYKNDRTDLTYKELEFGINEMVERDLNPHLLFGIIHLESNGKRNLTTTTSTARGYCQFIQGTGKWVYETRLNKGIYNHNLAFDGFINLEMGAEYLSYLMEKNNGSIMNTVLDYNGRELGSRYYDIVNDTLLKNINLSLNDIELEYKNKHNLL